MRFAYYRVTEDACISNFGYQSGVRHDINSGQDDLQGSLVLDLALASFRRITAATHACPSARDLCSAPVNVGVAACESVCESTAARPQTS